MAERLHSLDDYLSEKVHSVQQIVIITLVRHASNFSQPLNEYAFSVFKILDKMENKANGMKRETFQTEHALTTFYQAPIIPMIRW
jgi:hypothetical protein